MQRLVGVVAVLSALAVCPGGIAALETHSWVDHETEFTPQPEIFTFSPKLKPLWLEAFARSEVDLKRQAVAAIAKAHGLGMFGWDEAITPLSAALEDPRLTRVVAVDIAHTLIVLEARRAAPLLMKQVGGDDLDKALLVEPALARWDHQPMRPIWLARLEDPGTRYRWLILAIECLGHVGETKAIEPLRRLVLDPERLPNVRNQAAQAMGRIQREGLEGVAGQLVERDSPALLVDRLAAAALLRHHRGQDAAGLLLKLAASPDQAVVAAAMRRLSELDPMLVRGLNVQLAGSTDSSVRRMAAICLHGQQLPESIELLGELLDDPHPAARGYVADALVELDQIDRLSEPVRGAAVKMLATDQPRGLEQAALVIGHLDHEPAAERLVELLNFDHPKVSITSAWALRRLAVPETGDAIFSQIQKHTKETKEYDDHLWEVWFTNPPRIDFDKLRGTYDQVEHLMQALGVLDYHAGESLLATYFPKPPQRGLTDPPAVAAVYQEPIRAAAVWATARMYTDQPDGTPVATLTGMLDDASEMPRVRSLAVAGLAEMNVVSVIDDLRKLRGPKAAHAMLGMACGRALQRLAGDPLPEEVSRKIQLGGWFLEPTN